MLHNYMNYVRFLEVLFGVVCMIFIPSHGLILCPFKADVCDWSRGIPGKIMKTCLQSLDYDAALLVNKGLSFLGKITWEEGKIINSLVELNSAMKS